MSPFTPAWIEAQRRRWTRCNAHLWQKPVTWSRVPQPSLWPEVRTERPSAPPVGVSAESLRELRSLIAGIRSDLRALAQVHRDRPLRKYSPDQPRVPAGNPDGGQWTIGETPANSRDDSRVISDLLPPDYPKAGAQYAADESGRIDLRNEERAGGHSIAEHVGKSQGYLSDRVREEAAKIRERGDDFRGLGVTSFSSMESANKLVNSTIAQNQDAVDKVARGEETTAFLSARFGSATGYEAYLPTFHSQPYPRDTYGVGVFIVRDPTIGRGWRVQSAYPTR